MSGRRIALAARFLVFLLILSALFSGWYFLGPPAEERFRKTILSDSELSFVAESPNMVVRSFDANVRCVNGKVNSIASMTNRYGIRKEHTRQPEADEYVDSFIRICNLKPWKASDRSSFRSMQYTFQFKIRWAGKEHIFNSIGTEDPLLDDLTTEIKRLSGFGILEKQ